MCALEYDSGDGAGEAAKTAGAVMEMQGLFGPFQFPERLLQRIWAERAFCIRDANTADGRRVRVERAGRWNRLGGPDFLQARVCLGDEWREGDIEVHLREEDWAAHRHARDANYNNVVLHVDRKSVE